MGRSSRPLGEEAGRQQRVADELSQKEIEKLRKGMRYWKTKAIDCVVRAIRPGVTPEALFVFVLLVSLLILMRTHRAELLLLPEIVLHKRKRSYLSRYSRLSAIGAAGYREYRCYGLFWWMPTVSLNETAFVGSGGDKGNSTKTDSQRGGEK